MPIIANTTSGNTFSAVRAQLNSVTKRLNQFAINESAIYANTITANSTLRISGGVIANGSLGTSNYVLRTNGTTVYWAPGGGSTAQYLQVSNAVATYQTKAVERAALANTNSSIATQATRITLVNTNLTGTNTALRTLISDRLQVANAAAVYQTKAVERAALANTNSYIGAQATRINLINTNLTGTNTALRTLISDRLQVANAAATYQTKVIERAALANTNAFIKSQLANTNLRVNLINTNLTGTNTALRTLISDRLQVANAAAVYQTRAIERAALANTNAYIGAQATRITLVNTNLTGTNTALRSLISDRLQVSNAASVYQTKAVERASLANTNSYIGAQATRINLINTNLTGTNTALRTLISDRLQVANAAATYQTRAIERAALANTNSSIATQTSRINLINTNLTGTNTALRTLISDRLQVANASTLYATKSNPTTSGLLAHTGRATISTNLTVSGNTTLGAAGKVFTSTGLHNHVGRQTISTNLYVAGNTVLGNANTVTDRTIINGVLVANGNFSVAGNTTIGGASKTITMGGAASTLTIGGAGHTTNTTGWFGVAGRATISTNLSVSGNTILSGTLVANSSAGVAGYYLRTSGTGVYWSPVSASGGGANGFSGILVGANVISADSTTDRLTLVAGSGILLAANPTTDTITIATSVAATANVVSKAVKDLTQNDTVVTSVNGVVVAGSATGGGTDKVFYENDITITTSYTIGTNKNAMTAGPITINSGVTVTIPSGSVWSII
jgi:hypothetical protein